MTLEQIELTDLLPYIKIAFEEDTELPVYHISDKDYAWHTYDQICKTSDILPITCYKVGEIGFTVLSPGLLYSFGINVNYRDEKTLKDWFYQIKNIMPTFECVLHGKNSRAISHLVKQGMQVKEQLTVLTIK